MSGERYIIQGQTLTNLAEAIREKTGSETDYTPIEMATAIRNLPTGSSILGIKNIVLNGSYTASVDGLDGYSSVNVNVPNSYGLADEGKVVSNGELVAQTARSGSITQNGTYDTTNNNSVTVDVSGGGGSSGVYVGIDAPSSSLGSNGEYYYRRKFVNNSYGYTNTPGLVSGTTQSGYEFTAKSALFVVGLRGYVRGNTTGSLVLAAADGTVIKQIDNLTFEQGWNEALFSTPVQLTAGNNYIVQIRVADSYLSYQSKSSAQFNAMIKAIWGRYGSLPGSTDSSSIYSADIIIGTPDSSMVVYEQYYKDGGAWVRIA